ncbi:hypothetical protein BC827DRAFT_1375644 [Russula dissimulans]|nr:hypothetical protein BC827DRAFT_1375644 [Russula dissimulans]
MAFQLLINIKHSPPLPPNLKMASLALQVVENVTNFSGVTGVVIGGGIASVYQSQYSPSTSLQQSEMELQKAKARLQSLSPRRREQLEAAFQAATSSEEGLKSLEDLEGELIETIFFLTEKPVPAARGGSQKQVKGASKGYLCNNHAICYSNDIEFDPSKPPRSVTARPASPNSPATVLPESSPDYDDEEVNIFDVASDDQTRSKGKGKVREVAFDDELEDVGDGDESSVDDEDEDGRDEEREMSPQTIVELAYIANPKVFERDAATRRSKERATLRTQTGWVDEQIEGFKIMLDRDPKLKERTLEKHEFSGNEPSALELHRPGLAVAVAAGRRMPNLRADVGRAGAADAVAVADEDTTRWEEQEGQVVDLSIKTETNILVIWGERWPEEPSFELGVERLLDDLIY